MIAPPQVVRIVAGRLLLAAALVGAASAYAVAANAAEQAVADGKEAFGTAHFDWYNEATDGLEPIEFEPPPEGGRRGRDPGSLSSLVMWVGVAVFAVLLLLFIFYVVRQVSPEEIPQLPSRRGDEILAADQVEALGFLAERPRDDLLGQARKHYEQGNYGEAIIYLFSYQLVQLDKFALIQLTKGKTNRQYLREASRVPPLGGSLERTMLAFENVFFGQRGLDRAGFEACWNALPEFEQQLRATA